MWFSYVTVTDLVNCDAVAGVWIMGELVGEA